jgi:hypothetical protein
MDEHSAFIEHTHLVKPGELTLAFFIDALGRVKNKRLFSGRTPKFPGQIGVKSDRMRPAETRENAHRKMGRSHLLVERIVMANGCDTTQKVAYCPPP